MVWGDAMKVVLFCGGFGMRMRGCEHDLLPKPLQDVGGKPLVWHVMRYYAHFGYREFILCLGYAAPAFHEFFGRAGAGDWTVHLEETGIDSAIGERLRRVRHLIGDDEMFLANYADVLTDAPLDDMVAQLVGRPEAAGQLMAVAPQPTFHILNMTADHRVTGITGLAHLPFRENGGYLVLRREVIDLIPPGGDLIGNACMELADQGRLLAYPYDGFWRAADTFKERADLDAMWRAGERPWAMGEA